MIPMTHTNAVQILRQLIESRKTHIEYLEGRLDELREYQRTDPWEGNLTQIKRLQTRLVHARLEVEALEIVLT